MAEGARQPGAFEAALEGALRRVLNERLKPLEEELRRLRPPDDVLNVDGAAALLGWTPRTVRAKAKRGEIPAFKPPSSREWRFRRAELLAWAQNAAEVDIDGESRKIVSTLRGRR